jgi:hypothetical protein
VKILKEKLEEAQRNLESNAQMITWLNKQLNEKPGIGGSLMPPTSSKYGATTMSKPPTAMESTGFKPSIGSIE